MAEKNLKSSTAFDFGQANDKQRQAIETTEGPVLIIAGPGTGKTFTIVQRIVYLITEKNIEPEQILVATFTNKAADELVTRVANELLKMGIYINVNNMYIGTIHHVCLRLLDEFIEDTNLDRHYGQVVEKPQIHLMSRPWNTDRFKAIPDILDFYGSNAHGRRRIGGPQIFPKEEKRNLNMEKLVGDINNLEELCVYVDKMIGSDDVEEVDETIKKRAVCLGKAISLHRKILKENNKVTYTTMQTELLSLIRNHPEVLKKIQSKIKYFLIDEYQDVNNLQDTILRKLASENNNICVVGDDDQGLYRFRWASVENITKFKDKFTPGECTEIVLKDNYRSPGQVIDFYNRWMNRIDWQGFRYDKKIVPVSGNNDISVVRCDGPRDGNSREKRICNFVKKLKESGKITDYNQVAYLSVSLGNSVQQSLMDAMEREGIPVYAPRSKRFFKREEVNAFLGCLILAFEKYKDAFSGRFEEGGLYEGCLDAANRYISESPELNDWINNMMPKKRYLKKSFVDLAYELLAFEPFKTYLAVTPRDGVAGEREIRNISQLMNLINEYQDIDSSGSVLLTEKNIEHRIVGFFKYYLPRFNKIDEYEDKREYAPSGFVSFLTIHQSKGMEFPVVIVDFNDWSPDNGDSGFYKIIDQYSPYVDPETDPENFDLWRKFYTAFSRPQNLLVVTALYSLNGDKYYKYKPFFDDLIPCEDYDISLLDCTQVKPVNIKDRYSFTKDISVYDVCSIKYKFFKIYEFPQIPKRDFILGTVVHETIEHINKKVLEGESEKVIDKEYIREWVENDHEKLARSLHFNVTQGITEEAYTQVMDYVNHFGDKIPLIAAVETPVTDVKENYILEGTIDMIYEDKDGFHMIDFKSEKMPKDHSAASIMNYRRQLELYTFLYGRESENKTDKISLYYTRTNKNTDSPIIDFELSDETVNKTMEGIQSTISKIQNNEYDKGCADPNVCKLCEFRFYCNK